MQQKPCILMVEDSDEDFYTTTRILARFQEFDVNRCAGGAEVLPHLMQIHETKRLPKLILLDLNLHGKSDGRAVLSELKNNDRLRSIPVVVLTTSDSPKDIEHCYHHGAGGYMIKPVDLDSFTNSIRSMISYWFNAVTLPVPAQA